MTTPATYQDVVGVFDASGTQQFTMARSIKLQAVRDSKTMQHPLEDGSSVADHRVIQLSEVQMLLVLQAADYRDMYSQIQGLFNSAQLLTVQCKATSFESMYIASMPHEEDPDMFDAVQVILKLVEARFFKSQATASSRPRNSRSSPTIKRGEQSPTPRDSTLFNLFGKK